MKFGNVGFMFSQNEINNLVKVFELPLRLHGHSSPGGSASVLPLEIAL